MKKIIFGIVLTATVPFYTAAQTVEFSFGPDFSLGKRIYDLTTIIPLVVGGNTNVIILSERSEDTYQAWGAGFLFRFTLPSDHPHISAGYVMRANILAVTRLDERSSGHMLENNVITNYPTETQTRRISDDTWGMAVGNVALGSFYRIQLSDRFSVLFGPAFNFLVLAAEDRQMEINTLGIGLQAELAAQLYITPRMYLELGANGGFNAFSSTKVRQRIRGNHWEEYSIGGRFDGFSVTPYLHVGWNFNFWP